MRKTAIAMVVAALAQFAFPTLAFAAIGGDHHAISTAGGSPDEGGCQDLGVICIWSYREYHGYKMEYRPGPGCIQLLTGGVNAGALSIINRTNSRMLVFAGSNCPRETAHVLEPDKGWTDTPFQNPYRRMMSMTVESRH